MAEQSDLEKIAIDVRNTLKAKNTYNDGDGKKYKAGHTRALSDDETPVHGKGTGVYMDTYNGGGDLDINGSPEVVGSGRIKNKALNEYNEDKGYTKPDTSGNVGQIIVD
jgi:hypothetical protein